MKKENTILVTGSSGLLGAPIVKKLLKDGYNIIGLDPINLNIEHKNFVYFWSDNLDIETIHLCLEKYKIDKIIHAGGISGPMLFNDKPYVIVNNNIFLTLNLIEAARLYKKINRVIFCSSISAYGELNEQNIDETHKFDPNNLYGATKASCDLILEQYYKKYKLDIISLRLSTVYGHERKTDCFINDMIKGARTSKKIVLPFKEELHWPYIYVNDCVDSIISCLFFEGKHRYSYNISGPDFPSYEQIYLKIKSYYKDFKVNFNTKDDYQKRELFSIEKIKGDIGWHPKYDIDEGIDDMIKNHDCKNNKRNI